MHTTKRFIGEYVELSRDCELGQESERAVVVVLDVHYMTLHFLDRAPDCRDVHTGADYRYLRAYEGVADPDLVAVSRKAAREKLTTKAMAPAAVRRELRDILSTTRSGVESNTENPLQWIRIRKDLQITYSEMHIAVARKGEIFYVRAANHDLADLLDSLGSEVPDVYIHHFI